MVAQGDGTPESLHTKKETRTQNIGSGISP